MRKIEAKYGERLLVIGVHSPKFPAERETANLREAVLRYRIDHPVVNDRDFQIWNLYGGRAWPTLMFIDPQGRVISKHQGELPFAAFDPLVGGILKEYEERGLLRPEQAALALEQARESEHTLRFPGKVLATADLLYITDTNHHRVVEAQTDGRIRRTFGSGEPGLQDGPPGTARFQQPQGLARRGEVLYVADTGNHVIRAVDLDSGTVGTIAGTGDQAEAPGPGGPAMRTALSSPWDLVLDADRLFIAMAGLHQIWRLDLPSADVAPFAGTGREGRKDGALSEAWFAQSSGLAFAGGHLYVADSEVSAVRDIDVQAGTVATLVGEDLFVFGDQDGVGEAVRLQHPLGIAAYQGLLYIADSYNNKIKRLDPGTRRVTTWIGGPHPAADGGRAPLELREPGGIAAGPAGLYIADTNNHRVLLAEWETGALRGIIEG